MFSSKTKGQAPQAARKFVANPQTAVTILTEGCHFNGKLYTRGSSRIGGRIEGEVISEGILIIEESAHLSADVKADEVVIQGYVTGSLSANHRVEITPTGRFEGDITTPCLVVNEGAVFNGRSKMDVAQDIQDRRKLIGSVGGQFKSEGPELDTISAQAARASLAEEAPEINILRSPQAEVY